MRRSMIAVMAVVVLAGSASGRPAPFQVGLLDAGGAGVNQLGRAITWTGGEAYNPPIGSTLPPSAQQIAAFPVLQWDSYWAIDPNGPSTPASSTTATDGYSARAPNIQFFPLTSPTTPFQPGSWAGIWGVSGASMVQSGSNDRVFIGQVTLEPSATLSTLGVSVIVRDFGVSNPPVQPGLVKFGAANASNNGGAWGFNYYLDVELLPTNLGGQFTGWVTHAVYLKAIPAPGAAMVLVTAGLAAGRRRRATM
ncbi:MAG: hypothetical protein ACKVZJ_10525 [Phycisphaerales bacterium]